MSDRSVSFFRSLGVFSGLSPFDALRKNSWFRVLCHLFLMAFFCTVFIVFMEQRRLTPYWTAAEYALQEAFGNCFFQTANGFLPEKEPQRSRSLFLPLGGAVHYIAPDRKWDPGSAVLDKENFYLLLFGPGDIAGVICSGEETVLLQHAPGSSTHWQLLQPDRKSLPALLKKFPFGKPDAGPQQIIPVSALFSCCRMISFSLAFLGCFLSLYLLTILYTGIFIGIFRISSRSRLKVLSLRELWKCAVYASFPAMAVASCFPALELPFFQFSTIFMIGQMGYTLVVLSFFERNAAAKQPGEQK